MTEDRSGPTTKEVADALWGVRDWMLQRTEEYDSGLCQHLQKIGEAMVDISHDEAADLRIYARALDALAQKL